MQIGIKLTIRVVVWLLLAVEHGRVFLRLHYGVAVALHAEVPQRDIIRL